MDVHHHSHSPRKKWTHYFWEFLMLFLAVFCGFLAEYKLEHMLEHQRAKQYASTMLEDLKADKEALTSGIRTNRTIINYIDTLLDLKQQDNKPAKTSAQLYYYGRYGLRFWYYVNKQVTLEQMKQSGTVRYFQNSHLEKQMVSLDKVISFIRYWDERDKLFNVQAISYSSRLFNYSYLKNLPTDIDILEKNEDADAILTDGVQSRNSFLHSDPPLVNNQPELTLEFLNFCNQRIPVLRAKVSVYEAGLAEIEKITSELKDEYRLN